MNDKKIKIELGSVQKTLLVPLFARAKEIEKKNPLLFDTIAREIIAKTDYDFSMIETGIEDNHQLVWIIRSINFDNCIKEFLLQYTNALVINLGAGLDTTFQRVDNGNVFWINMDLPDVISLRHKMIPNTEREINIAKSMFDFTWIDDIAQQTEGRSILLIAAGVFCYFRASELEVLFKKLSSTYPSAHLIFDAMSWLTVWGSNRSIMKKSGMDSSAMLKWHLKRTSILKKWVNTIKIIDKYPMFSRLPSKTDLNKKILRGMKIADILGMYKMIHVKL